MFRTNEDVYALVKAFEERTVPRSEWTHAAHLVVGLYYCRTLPFSVAKNVMRDGIHWLNDTHGAPNTGDSGYHETLTVFWLKRIWNFLDSRVTATSLVALANELIEEHPDADLPLRFYTRELLFSPGARRDYVPPDRPRKAANQLSITSFILKPLL